MRRRGEERAGWTVLFRRPRRRTFEAIPGGLFGAGCGDITSRTGRAGMDRCYNASDGEVSLCRRWVMARRPPRVLYSAAPEVSDLANGIRG